MSDYIARPLSEFSITTLKPADQISEHFTARELVRSELATRLNISNWFQSDVELWNAIRVCREVLEPVRNRFWPFSPNSVYRSQALERKLKAKPTTWVSPSQHTKGEACDIEMPGLTNLDLARWVKDHLKFDQLILEMYDAAKGPNSGWVHVSLKLAGNRGELLTFDGKTYRHWEG